MTTEPERKERIVFQKHEMIMTFNSHACSFFGCPVCDRQVRIDKDGGEPIVFKRGNEAAHAQDELAAVEAAGAVEAER